MTLDNPENQETLLVTAKDVSKLLGLSVRTVNNWRRAGKLPPPVTNPKPGYRRWQRRDIEIWVAAGCTKRGWRRAKGK
ncbi:helix-turn-helix domain-containing protein [Rubripirellula sp.]|nr:helix-turn-helix domain-containing protein [Rubripirellula sp.]